MICLSYKDRLSSISSLKEFQKRRFWRLYPLHLLMLIVFFGIECAKYLADFYFGFNHWKSAAIIHGVYARYRAGQKSTDGIDLDEIKGRIDASLSAADFCIKRYKER